ncbi:MULTISPECIES: hypothetical protein [Acetobacter]|jgi:hypothetical protein|uniref:Uncharacterized protein n=1 Tax=Acetobacter lovaniensis TaxID=104100 RepID=A0A841QJR2_9PROT|nr:hypothetical protein [Acetobacter lovaniensis]MBB6458363.1 hypothetical protein [Acetobacter lovaniensis]MCP1240734.1 hypothetical protein [Acetobacter lovaniensis]NHN82572.1 hypothetical protein [Acetobacter lovaniensis]
MKGSKRICSLGMNMTLRALHDARLTRLTLDWQSGLLSFHLVTGEGPVILTAQRVRNLECPRLHPWGPSVSVNEITTCALEEELRLQVEMQSGDIIEVICADFNLQQALVETDR